MKLLAYLCLSLALVTAPIAIPVAFTGCKQATFSQQSTDQVILRAEQTAQTARLTFDTFVTLERQNDALLRSVNPAIHQYANYIRAHGLDYVKSLSQSIDTFQANRTAQNQATLNTWLTTLNDAVRQTNLYLAQSKATISHQ